MTEKTEGRSVATRAAAASAGRVQCVTVASLPAETICGVVCVHVVCAGVN